MKNIITTLLIGIVSLNMNAQREIEEKIDYNNQFINVDVKFASEIELKTWNKSYVYVKANLTTEEGKYLDLYELEIDESNNRIDIIEKAENLFKKYQEEYNRENPNQEKVLGKNYSYSGSVIIDEGEVIIHDGLKYKFDYVIYIPEGAEFKVSSINGNLNSEVINGDFTADLINGNINIKEYSGDLKLNTINGEINLTLNNSNMLAETIHGDIYANENLEFTSSKQMVGQKIRSKNSNGANEVHLKTINGNMYLN